jgi:hypothetical protein
MAKRVMKSDQSGVELRTVLVVFCAIALLLIAQLAALDGWLGL